MIRQPSCSFDGILKRRQMIITHSIQSDRIARIPVRLIPAAFETPRSEFEPCCAREVHGNHVFSER